MQIYLTRLCKRPYFLTLLIFDGFQTTQFRPSTYSFVVGHYHKVKKEKKIKKEKILKG
jgi:hypothetical protein